MVKSAVLNAANSMVGPEQRGVLVAPGGNPVLATPATVLTVGLFAAASATPATGALFGGTAANGEGALGEVELTGASVDELTEAREAALIG
ncbi:hypothetical protein [Kitasatospora sp. NPDC047058]|uniref:hypothetical protein n=1 Tax=Kitasatospora sp. NPDC047058 TaxID=3155620 RepID=UPI0033EE6DD3